MKDFDVKHLISKLTRVTLVKPRITEAMADVPGVCNISNRGREWHEYTTDSLNDVPPVMKQEFEAAISGFKNSFTSELQKMGNQIPENLKLIYAYYAKDPAVDAEQLEAINSVTDEQKKQRFLDAIDFINSHGLRLWMSPDKLSKYLTFRKGNHDSYNGSQKYFERFGYAWGATKVSKGKSRQSKMANDQDSAAAEFNSPDKGMESDAIDTSNVRTVKIVTAPKNQGFGIYFQDKNGRLFPVINDKYYEKASQGDFKRNEDGTNFVDKRVFISGKGQHEKFYGIKGNKDSAGRIQVTNVLPTQSRFKFNNNDITSVPYLVPKGSGVEAFSGSYRLSIKDDGTLWWIENDNKENKFPLTREQVDFFNVVKDTFYNLTNPDTLAYDWSTIDPRDLQQKQEEFVKVTSALNELYDFLYEIKNPPGSGISGRPNFPCVGLNAYKYCVVGPAFQAPENLGVQQTVGRLPSPNTYVDAIDSKTSVVLRADWVVIANEFNEGRASSRGGRGFSVGQSMDGNQAKTSSSTLKDALDKAFRTWAINAPEPDPEAVAEADRIFSQVHNTNQEVNQETPVLDEGNLGLSTSSPADIKPSEPAMLVEPQSLDAPPVIQEQKKIPLAKFNLKAKIAKLTAPAKKTLPDWKPAKRIKQ